MYKYIFLFSLYVYLCYEICFHKWSSLDKLDNKLLKKAAIFIVVAHVFHFMELSLKYVFQFTYFIGKVLSK